MIHAETLVINTPGRGLHEVSDAVQRAVHSTRVTRGLCTLFLHHTSASLLITENADRDVLGDLDRFLERLVPDGDRLFRHTAEGPDDMPAHVRSALTQVSLTIPIADGRCDLGTWQGIFLWEHRHSAHRRRLTISVVGESAPSARP